jgi:hypothetical protein
MHNCLVVVFVIVAVVEAYAYKYVWHTLELFRTRRPVVGMFQRFDMSRHVCVFTIGFFVIRAQSEMVYSQIVCDRW